MYQIGAFSKICQTSVKTLRHYDKIGLLKPAAVDRFTGYRYYDDAQLTRMLLIQRLKRYGFALEEIQTLLQEDEPAFRQALLRQKDKLHWQQMELGMTIQELTLHLQTLERKGKTMDMQGNHEMKLMETPAMAVLSCRKMMSVDEFGYYYGTLYERIAQNNLTPNGVFGAMYHDEEFNRESSDVELFIGVRETEKADRTMESQFCATTTHKGPYSTLSETYAALVSWIAENGYEWNGAPYDIYTKTAQNGYAPADWETEVYFPVHLK